VSTRSPEQWADLYDDLRPTYRAFTDKLETLVEELLDNAGTEYSWVQAGTSSPGVFESALLRELRRGASFDDPFESRLNPAVVMVVAVMPEGAEEIVDLITREFDVDEGESLTLRDATEANERLLEPGVVEIDYAWPRYLVSLGQERAALPEWSPYESLRCVVDVPTLLQYVWNRLDLELPFYWAGSYPVRARDALARFSAGLASLDAALGQARAAVDELYTSRESAIASGRLTFALDGVSLKAYLRSSQTVAELVGAAVEAGMRHDTSDDVTFLYAEQGPLWLLDRLGMRTIADLDDFLREAAPRAPEIFRELCQVSSNHDFEPWAVPYSVVEWLSLVVNRVDAETIALFDYAHGIDVALNTLIGNPIDHAR
jgi:hypothetical protein